MSSVSSAAMRAPRPGGIRECAYCAAGRRADQQHPHIVGDGEQKLAQILACSLLGDEVELFQLGQLLDQMADLMAEQPVDLGAGGVVSSSCRAAAPRRWSRRQLQVGEDGGDLERCEKRIADAAFRSPWARWHRRKRG